MTSSCGDKLEGEGVANRQETLDRFYWAHGPCCAGCDHWCSSNSVAGECRKAAPVSAHERVAVLGWTNLSLNIGAGHPLTGREHHCGDFADAFDWSSLTAWYLRKIGAPQIGDRQ